MVRYRTYPSGRVRKADVIIPCEEAAVKCQHAVFWQAAPRVQRAERSAILDAAWMERGRFVPRRTLAVDTSSKLRRGLACKVGTAQNFRNPHPLICCFELRQTLPSTGKKYRPQSFTDPTILG